MEINTDKQEAPADGNATGPVPQDGAALMLMALFAMAGISPADAGGEKDGQLQL